MENLKINHAAVWVCVVLLLMLGYLWYGVLFNEQWMEMITRQEQAVAGTVTIGFPDEFGHTLLMPLLARISHEYPQVVFNFRIGLVSALAKLLLNGDVDFAFIDEFGTDARIKTSKVYDEIHELCICPELLKKTGKRKI